MEPPKPIAARIREHYRTGIGYHELMLAVFPAKQYPRAYRGSMNGGPPGCAMAFGAAIHRLGGMRDGGKVWIPNQP